MHRWWTADHTAGRAPRPDPEEVAPAATVAEPVGSAIDAVLVRAGRRPAAPTGQQPAEPALRLVVLTCMDARVDPVALLGLRPGEAHVIRNAGGLADHGTLAALRLSRTALGTREAMVIHHTGCAAVAALGRRDAEAGVRAEVERVQAAAPAAWRSVRGFVLDLESGRLSEVWRRSRPPARRRRRF
jgi:carbonic anhydrase